MSYRNIRFLLWFLSVVFILGALWMIDYFVINPSWANVDSIKQIGPVAADLPLSPQSVVRDRSKLLERDFQHVWEKRLRGPLEDPPPALPRKTPAHEPEVAVARQKQPDIVLAGTIIEPDVTACRAWIVLPGGVRKLVTVGQSLDELAGQPVVIAIEDGRVIFQWIDSVFIKEISADVTQLFKDL
jgi:hypothetical protein